MATEYAGKKIVTDGLVLCLDAADRNSYVSGSTTWNDLAGSNNGTLTNGPTFSTDGGGSILFDGVDDYVDCGSSNLNIGDSVTVDTWLYFNTLSGYITWFSYGGFVPGGFVVQRAGDANRLRFAWNQSSPFYDGPSFTTTGQWVNMCVVVKEGSQVEWYVNTFKTLAGTISTFAPSNPNTVEIGRRTDSGGIQYVDGKVSSTKIYNRALSTSEVLQNYNATKGRFGL